MKLESLGFSERLLAWYDGGHRMLPWRVPGSNGRPDPWHVLVSEFMLQQTRVEAVRPYFHKFTKQFPDARSLAQAPEAEALAAWSGLGYYSRIRNLQRAAQMVAAEFPATYEALRQLPGVGPYTAAAIASIAFDLPHAVADGNVFRVLARFTGDAADIGLQTARQRLTCVAQSLLDPLRPGDFNQAMMELGATVCLPRAPQCLLCPVAFDCKARQEGRQAELPVKRAKSASDAVTLEVLVIRQGAALLLRQRPSDAARMPCFWELPTRDAVPCAGDLRTAGEFIHTIVNTRHTVKVWSASVAREPDGMIWSLFDRLGEIPLTTISKKALACVAATGTTDGLRRPVSP